MSNISQVSRKVYRYLPALAAGGLALCLYVYTAAPWITWANDGADGGDLIAAAMTWGVPHPSGYPTYCLLGRLFAVLPLGSVAQRFNLFSATMAAAAVGLVYLSTLRILTSVPGQETWLDRTIALIVSLAFAASPTFWSQAIIAEVYAPLAFFFAVCLYLALRTDLLERACHWAIMGATFGLGLGMHLTLIWMLPGLALLLWSKARPARLLALALGMLCGLSVYLYLPLAARGDPPINWGDPRTLGGFWWVVSGKLYQGYLFALPAEHLLSRLGAWSRLWFQQYTWVGLALALTGLWSWLERGWRLWALATVLMFLIYGLYAITYDTTDSYVYLIPSFLLTALWMAEGAKAIIVSLGKQKTARALVALGLVLLVGIPTWSLLSHYRALDLSRDHAAAQWAEETLRQLPEGAVLITGEDRHTFTLDYVRWVEGRRQDLLVIDGELLLQPWYADQLARRYPSLREIEDQPSLEQLIGANLDQRAIYLASLREDLAQAFVLTPSGTLWRISGQR
jgi:hypothetical protein